MITLIKYPEVSKSCRSLHRLGTMTLSVIVFIGQAYADMSWFNPIQGEPG